MAKNSHTHVALTESAPKSNPLAGVLKTLWLQGKQPRDVGDVPGLFFGLDPVSRLCQLATKHGALKGGVL